MRVSHLLIAAAGSLVLQNAFAADRCPSFESARETYLKGDSAGSIAILKCRKDANPADLDSRRFLSDVYWWEGDTEHSVSEAQAIRSLAQASPDEAKDEEMQLHLADRLSRYRLKSSVETLWGRGQSGNELGLGFSARYSGKDEIQANVLRKARIFSDSSVAKDESVDAGEIHAVSRQVYLETHFSYSPDPVFSSRWSLSTEPHWVIGSENDFSLLAKWARYTSGNVLTFSPAWLKPVSHRLSLGARTYIVSAETWMVSGMGSAEWAFNPRWSVKGSYSAGSAYEGSGLHDHFNSTVLGTRVRLTAPFSIGLQGERYRGDIRSETRVGTSFEWNF